MCYNVQARERNAQNLGVAQLVARYLGVVEAASSSLVTQTKNTLKTLGFQGIFLLKIKKVPSNRHFCFGFKLTNLSAEGKECKLHHFKCL